MAVGVALQISISIVLLILACTAGARLYLKGYLAGVRHEAQGWINAISKVTPPNWQSLPISDDVGSMSKESLIETNKLYVVAFKTALEVIKAEIAVLRVDALIDEIMEPASE